MAMVVGNTDVLTGLFNMKGLKQNYGSYLSKNKKCLVIAFDFAKLKYINDNYGHAVGDSCLSNFGEVLKQNFYGDMSCWVWMCCFSFSYVCRFLFQVPAVFLPLVFCFVLLCYYRF